MNSDNIFDYSDSFLKEIIEVLINLKIQKKNNLRSSEFENKLKSILGKNLIDLNFEELSICDDKKFKEILSKKFQESREERIRLLGKDQSKEIEKEFFYKRLTLIGNLTSNI